MADTCAVTGTLCTLDGTPLGPGVPVIATIRSTQADQGGQVAAGVGISLAPIEALTTETGTFELQLIQGTTVLLEIPVINLRKYILVPAAATVDFVTLI